MQASRAEQVLEGVVATHPVEEPDKPVAGAAKAAAEAVETPMRPGNPTLEQLLGRAEAMGLDARRFQQYADRRWGRGWKINLHGRGRAWDEMERFANDPEGYADKIDCALGAVAGRV